MPGGIRVSSFKVLFGSRHVSVTGTCDETISHCRRMFANMLGECSAETSLVTAFEVERSVSDYELRDQKGSVIAKTPELQELQQILKSEVTLELIRALPEFLWLHASGAALNDQAVLLTGVSGRGKSTLVSSLCERGWKYLSDDMLPLDSATGYVFPFPATATRRVPEASGALLPPERFDELKRVFVDMPAESVQLRKAKVVGIIIPEFSPQGTHQLKEAKGFSAAADLLEGCINFIDHDQSAIRSVCALIESIPVHQLTWSDSALASEAIINAYS